MNRCTPRVALALAALVTLGHPQAAIADFHDFGGDPDGWFDAVGSWTTIGFDDLPIGTDVTDQYADLGAIFVDADPNRVRESSGTYPQDGFGLAGFHVIDIVFDDLMFAYAGHHPGTQRLRFYRGGELLFASSDLGLGGGVDLFSGFVSDIGFDRVETIGWSVDPEDIVGYDNIYFSTIPAPGAIVLVACGGLTRRRRR